jgi:hypothetical protein
MPRDAHQRSDSWFKALNAFLNSLKADKGLSLASRTIDQIAKGATACRAHSDQVDKVKTVILAVPSGRCP